MEEHHCYGGPGAGKTRWLQRQARIAIERGHSPDDLLFCSYTRAAAETLRGRDLPIKNERQIGTLHSLCYHALDRPNIAENYITSSDNEHIRPWNQWSPPGYELSVSGVSVDEVTGEHIQGGREGDPLFASMERHRAMMVPRDQWPIRIQRFAQYWDDWCNIYNLTSFTGMIEQGLERLDSAPGNPAVGFFDEAQDFSRLQISLVKKWGAKMDYFILAGDPNQCIYSFLGASPRVFLEADIPDRNRHFLPRSYRMSREVHSAAQWWISQAQDRAVFDFEPRDEEGYYGRAGGDNNRYVHALIETAEKYVNMGYSVMLLATTSYHVDEIKHELRKQAFPFHNPYRRRRGDWNPLHSSRGISTATRLAEFLRTVDGPYGPAWTAYQVKLWSELIGARGVMLHGKGKRYLNSLPDDHVMGYMDMQQVFHQPTVEELMPEAVAKPPGAMWIYDRAKKQRQKGLEYPISVAENRGAEALIEDPKIVIGTVHSVKGGEADVVILVPDLSPAGWEEWSGIGRDNVVRVFYVGISRAREATLIAESSTGLYPEPLLASV